MLKYKNYIESDEWRERSFDFLKRYPLCEFCGIEKSNQVHHKSYENIGKEKDKDLTAVCDVCHLHIHKRPVILSTHENTQKAEYILRNLLNKRNKTLRLFVLNDLSRDFYNYRMMLDVIMERYPKTPLFDQALLYILEDDSQKLGVDLIEYVYKDIYNYKMQIGTKRNEVRSKNLTQKYTNQNIDFYSAEDEVGNMTDEEILKGLMLQYIRAEFNKFKREDSALWQDKKKDPSINEQSNYQIWASKLNKYFYGNKHWNEDGLKEHSRFHGNNGKWEYFIKVLYEDGFLTELYLMLGGSGDAINE